MIEPNNFRRTGESLHGRMNAPGSLGRLWFSCPAIILGLAVLAAPLPAEVLFRLTPELEAALPPDVRSPVGKEVTLASEFLDFFRDPRRRDPGYPWIVTAGEWVGLLDDSAYRRCSSVLEGLTPGSAVEAKGRWGVLVGTEKIEGAEFYEAGEDFIIPVLIIDSLQPRPRGSPSGAPTPPPDWQEIYRSIRDEELKAVRDPQYASSARKKIAQLYLKAGQPQKAINEYRFEMILNPSQVSYYHRKIGEVHQQMGDQESARLESELARLTQKESKESLYRRRLSQWVREGKYELAIQEYQYLLQTDRGARQEYLEKIAQLYGLMGDREHARYYYQKLIESFEQKQKETASETYDRHLHLARVYEDLGDFTAARKEYDLAAEVMPDKKAEVVQKTAQLLERQGKFRDALSLYRGLEGKQGVDPVDLQLRIARLMERLNDPAGALREYEKAVSLAGKEGGRIRLKLASLYLAARQPEKALQTYQAALPGLAAADRAGACEASGDILAQLGRKPEAFDAYREAIEILQGKVRDNPDEGTLGKLAGLEEKTGDPEAARNYYNALIGLLSDRLAKEPGLAASYRRRLAGYYEKAGKYEELVAYYKDWIRQEPDDAAPYRQLYQLYREHFRDDKLAEFYQGQYRQLRKKQGGSQSKD